MCLLDYEGSLLPKFYLFVMFIDIQSKLKRIEDDPDGSGTSHLFNCIQGVSSLANRAFEPLFERQVGVAQRIVRCSGLFERQGVSSHLFFQNAVVGSN